MFNERLQKIRKERGLTQKELADDLTLSPQTISNWEKNITKPDFEQVVDLAKYFGTSISYFAGIDEEKKKSIIPLLLENNILDEKGNLNLQELQNAINEYTKND